MLAFLQENLIPEIPLEDWTNSVEEYITSTFGGFFDLAKDGLEGLVDVFEAILLFPPELVMVGIIDVDPGFEHHACVGKITPQPVADLLQTRPKTVHAVLAAVLNAIAQKDVIGVGIAREGPLVAAQKARDRLALQPLVGDCERFARIRARERLA